MKYSIELMRIIAVILITFTHTRNNFDAGIPYYIFEVLPTYGTPILSIISGYLYWTVSKDKENFFKSKIQSLAIPYLISNILVFTLAVLIYFVFNIELLNRYEYNTSIITDGIFALNQTPINPPTYFIRDIFILFTIIELVKNRNFWVLIILLPYLVWGEIFIRLDIIILFGIGVLYAILQKKTGQKSWLGLTIFASIIAFLWLEEYLKYPIAMLVFVSLINLDFKFIKTGSYSYLLHLYHSPFIVSTFPIINKFIGNPVLNVIIQVCAAYFFILIAHILITRKFPKLKILSGGR